MSTCRACKRPQATAEDHERYPNNGDGTHLCWAEHDIDCEDGEPIDLRAECLRWRTIERTTPLEMKSWQWAVDVGGSLGQRQGETVREAAERVAAECLRLREELERLEALINTPETEDWVRGVELEAAHQVERWGTEHDAGKTALDWFWLLGYLAQKAAESEMRGDVDKAKHHTVSTGAALLNWHRKLSGADTGMRPGIKPPNETP